LDAFLQKALAFFTTDTFTAAGVIAAMSAAICFVDDR
jgi:hypothetical protein